MRVAVRVKLSKSDALCWSTSAGRLEQVALQLGFGLGA